MLRDLTSSLGPQELHELFALGFSALDFAAAWWRTYPSGRPKALPACEAPP